MHNKSRSHAAEPLKEKKTFTHRSAGIEYKNYSKPVPKIDRGKRDDEPVLSFFFLLLFFFSIHANYACFFLGHPLFFLFAET